ncbi:MAG: hypothetical protein WBA39_12845 [Rivularia sp. (in: cyanobacteria)]
MKDGNWELGNGQWAWGDKEMGRQGDGEMGRWGINKDSQFYFYQGARRSHYIS